MSVYTLEIKTAASEVLLEGLDELAENWTKTSGRGHQYSEAVIYGEIRDALRKNYGQDYVITEGQDGICRVERVKNI